MVGSRFEKSTPTRRKTHTHATLNCRKFQPPEIVPSHFQRLRSLKLSQNTASRWGEGLGPEPNRANCTLAFPEAQIPETVANSSLQKVCSCVLIHGFLFHSLFHRGLFIHDVLLHEGKGTPGMLPQMWWDTSNAFLMVFIVLIESATFAN